MPPPDIFLQLTSSAMIRIQIILNRGLSALSALKTARFCLYGETLARLLARSSMYLLPPVMASFASSLSRSGRDAPLVRRSPGNGLELFSFSYIRCWISCSREVYAWSSSTDTLPRSSSLSSLPGEFRPTGWR